MPLASIVIDNYNYAQYLPAAVDSALAQEYPHIEVVVVDDGSTDDSRRIIESYGDRLQPVFKRNGGQASALNSGFARSRGDIVLFLDSDDILHPQAVANAVRLFAPGVSKVHWPLRVVNAEGHSLGRTKPGGPLPVHDLRETILRTGPSNCGSPPTSGNAWARWFLNRIMPIPEDVPYYRVCADEYLFTLAPFFGQVRAIQEVHGLYRMHGQNIYSGRNFNDQLELELTGYDQHAAVLARVLDRQGITIDVAEWKRHSWFHRLQRALHDIERTIPSSERFILADDDTWGCRQIFGPGRVQPFTENEGEYWGPPPDDSTARAELGRLRTEGAAFLVLAWPAFWWINYYSGTFDLLRSSFTCALATEDIVIYDLRQPTGAELSLAAALQE